ncbi:MAG: hypothetical protein CSB48_05080 [Proteobacteria bacterium]|nr:MAG: hypothetical protein CSB48_05080 [Pseudomonadota bacterium]PIE40269.1 MAG: hypothetical protein CSA51_01680 [Gammaproteobacteria bacterium]
MPNSSLFAQQLRDKIRHAREPDNPTLLMTWLNLEESECLTCSRDQQWQRHVSSVELLLDTFTDELNPAHWRTLCLNNLARPLGCLQRLARNDRQNRELRHLLREVSTLSHYFCPGLTRHHRLDT